MNGESKGLRRTRELKPGSTPTTGAGPLPGTSTQPRPFYLSMDLP